MSIFIDNLAFEDKVLVDTGKASILITSLAASTLGLAAVYVTSGLNKQNKMTLTK